MKSPKAVQKKILIFVCLPITVLLVGLILIHLSLTGFDITVKAHDVGVTNREMIAARTTLIPLLKPLDIIVAAQVPATCEPGDPSLYAHSCGTQSAVTYGGTLNSPQDAD